MINRLDWDSNFFEIEVGELIYKEYFNYGNADVFDLLYIKSNNDFELEVNNFKNAFSECKVVFSKSLIFSEIPESNIYSIGKTDYHIEEIYELAFESGKYSRFFLDKNFEKVKFKELYKLWVDNSILGKFANDLLIYKENNIVLGFVSYKINNQSATIGLIAVHPNCQGKGIGAKLLKKVENVLLELRINTLYIPTQESNDLACKFYNKQGYHVHEKTHIKHYWKI